MGIVSIQLGYNEKVKAQMRWVCLEKLAGQSRVAGIVISLAHSLWKRERKVLQKKVSAENSNMELDKIRNKIIFKERYYAGYILWSHCQHWSVGRDALSFYEVTPLHRIESWGRIFKD